MTNNKPDEIITAGVITFDANVIAAILERHGAAPHVAAHCAAEILAYLKEACGGQGELLKGTLQ